MKILHVIPSLDMGGAEQLCLNLASAQKSLGHDVSVCCIMTPPEKGALYKKAGNLGIRCYYTYCKQEPRVIPVIKFIRFLRRLSPDVVQSHLPRTNSCTAVSARIAGIKCIIATFHNPLIWKNKRQKKWGIRTMRLQDGIFCDAEYIRSRLIKLCPKTKERIRVVYPSLPFRKSRVDTTEVASFKDKWGLRETDRIVGIVARLAKVKDHETFLNTAQIVLKKNPAVKFLIAGHGPLKETIINKIAQMGLKQSILALGYVPCLELFLSTLELFVLSSLSEGFPLSILEALSKGIPVIATRVGGIPEIIQPGENGFLFEPKHPEEAAEYILKILENQILFDRMKKKAMQSIEPFSIEVMAKKTIQYYKELKR